MTILGYGRVSTMQQNTENQRLGLGEVGWQIDYWYASVVSGKVPVMHRKAFSKVLSRTCDGETLVAVELDQLGRNATDVLQAVRALTEHNAEVIVHQLSTTDLASPTDKLLSSMLVAVVEMERGLLIKRAQTGLLQAKAEGKKSGRPSKITPGACRTIIEKKGRRTSVSALAREYGISRAAIATIIEFAQAVLCLYLV